MKSITTQIMRNNLYVALIIIHTISKMKMQQAKPITLEKIIEAKKPLYVMRVSWKSLQWKMGSSVVERCLKKSRMDFVPNKENPLFSATHARTWYSIWWYSADYLSRWIDHCSRFYDVDFFYKLVLPLCEPTVRRRLAVCKKVNDVNSSNMLVNWNW